MDTATGLTLCLVLFAVLGLAAFYWMSSYALKQRWHPRIVLGGAVLFLTYVAFSYESSALLGALPPTALVAFVALRFPRFCAGCGEVLTRSSVWVGTNYCPQCGTRVQRPAR